MWEFHVEEFHALLKQVFKKNKQAFFEIQHLLWKRNSAVFPHVVTWGENKPSTN